MDLGKDFIDSRRIQVRRMEQRRGDQRRSVHIPVASDRRTTRRRLGATRRRCFRRVYPSRRSRCAEILLERRVDIILENNILGEKK